MTHDLMRDVFDSLAVDVARVVVTDLQDKTFYAELHLISGGEERVVSCRPSDAIALAVRTGTPIFAAEAVIDEVGFVEGEHDQDDQPEEVVEEFKEFLDTISPEDFED